MKKFKFLIILSVLPLVSLANFKDVVTNIRTNYIEPIFFPVIGLIFLVGVLMNIGNLWGEKRDYMGFFKGLIIYLAIVLSISTVYGIIIALTL